ncbi:MAG: DUF1343 domain-containing protein [Bacteroidales bacterium]|jgi:uncharacterized protein YbbC (DUF1343 family)|nr:DUF1343 domain-containing protein [Bacteroidales bacterium]NLM91607.1 DUF1343 domain-containing protein [Bacteroidales bacterium]
MKIDRSITRIIALGLLLFFPLFSSCRNQTRSAGEEMIASETPKILVGAERTDQYFPLLAGKRLAVAANHTSMIGEVHLVDTLRSAGFNVVKVFSPEHGFRGTAAAGELVDSGLDERTGIPVVSLYGANRRPRPEQLADVDLILIDLQDVGMRFYTYISTMSMIMQTAARVGKAVMVLDRPNPHGHYIDGPLLDPKYGSFVGLHPVPVVHGMTMGEYALMVKGEGWLGYQAECDLTVIPVENYTHNDLYQLPVAPSPNLPNMQAVYLYPSLCFFEGTVISIGRGTPMPFQVFGNPWLPAQKFPFTFVPQSLAAAPNPPALGETCNGKDLRNLPLEDLMAGRQIDLSYLLEAFRNYPEKDKFFNNYFDRLAGNNLLRNQVLAGQTEAQIRESWKPGLEEFKKIRVKYLLYPDFDNIQ